MIPNRPKPSSTGTTSKPISSGTPKASERITSNSSSVSVTPPGGISAGAGGAGSARFETRSATSIGAGISNGSGSASGKEPVHLPLYRRLLFPYQSIEEDVPGLVKGPGDLIETINERYVSRFPRPALFMSDWRPLVNQAQAVPCQERNSSVRGSERPSDQTSSK